MIDPQHSDQFNERLLALLDKPGELFTALKEVWREEINEDVKLSGSALARLQNEGHCSVFKLGLDALPLSDNVFDVIHLLKEAVPFLDEIDADFLVKFEMETYKKTHNDLAGGILRNTIMTRFELYPSEAREVIERHVASPREETGPIYRSALIGLAVNNFKEAVGLAFEAVDSPVFFIAANAISALGSFSYKGKSIKTEFEHALALIEKHAYSSDSNLAFVSAVALQQVVSSHPSRHEKLKKLVECSTKEGYYAVSEFLFRNLTEYKKEQWLYDLIDMCVAIPADHKGTIDNLDFVLSGLVCSDDSKFDIANWLYAWVGSQSDKNLPVDIPTLFDSTSRKLFECPRHILNTIITKWLIEEDLRYPAAVHRIASYMTVRRLSDVCFHKPIINDMDKEDLILLVRRTIGWIFDSEIRINLLWSLATAKNAIERTHEIVLYAFNSILSYEYPHNVKQFIEPIHSKETSPELVQLCDNILQSIDTYNSNIEALKPVKELDTSPEKYRAFKNARRKEMEKAKDIVEEESIFAQIATRITVKDGTGTFTRNLEGRGYTGRSEFASISTRFALPRSAVINVVGSEHLLSLFRSSQRGEE